MNKFAFAAVLIAAVMFLGCQQGSGLVPAGGTVRLKGAPLDGAAVTVHYGDGNLAQDVTHDGGKFALTYLGSSGAKPGKNLKVTVRKVKPPYSAPPRTDSQPPNPAVRTGPGDVAGINATDPAERGKKPAEPDAEVDASYELTIPAGGSSDLIIDLP